MRDAGLCYSKGTDTTYLLVNHNFFLTLSPVHLVCVCWCPMRLEECVALELELEVTVRHLTWVLGNELWSFERATSTLNH